MMNKKLPSISGVDALIFYTQRLKLIKGDLNCIGYLWKDCMNPQRYKDDLMTHDSATCNRRQETTPCQHCIDNKAVAKEKRRLKAQFNKTVEKMLQFPVSGPVLCHKIKPTFTDLNTSQDNAL